MKLSSLLLFKENIKNLQLLAITLNKIIKIHITKGDYVPFASPIYNHSLEGLKQSNCKVNNIFSSISELSCQSINSSVMEKSSFKLAILVALLVFASCQSLSPSLSLSLLINKLHVFLSNIFEVTKIIKKKPADAEIGAEARNVVILRCNENVDCKYACHHCQCLCKDTWCKCPNEPPASL